MTPNRTLLLMAASLVLIAVFYVLREQGGMPSESRLI